MKISAETLSILKNFALINKGILITPGKVLRTRTPAVLAEATVAEEFPVEVGIYDLANFLSVINLFKDPEFDFGKDSLRIAEADGRAETRYAYAGAGLVALNTKANRTPPPAPNSIKFVLTEDQWATINKAVTVYQKPELSITSNGKIVRMGTENHKQAQGNSYSMALEAEANGLKCNMIFQKENINLLKGSYEGTVLPSYTIFTNTSGYALKYFIGADPSSTFGEE